MRFIQNVLSLVCDLFHNKIQDLNLYIPQSIAISNSKLQNNSNNTYKTCSLIIMKQGPGQIL